MEVTAARRSFLCDIGYWADRTALHEAASQGRALQLKQLIDSGACVNTVTVDNITPLHEASLRGHCPCVRLLLRAGAQVDVRTIHGSTPLCNACASGNFECVQLLLDQGANVNPSLTALTASPLHEACIQGDVAIVKLLISRGAELEFFDVHFGPPLHIAAAKGHVACVRALLQAGARVNSVKFHETALHLAARGDSVVLVDTLMEFGANVFSSDNSGNRPRDHSKEGTPCYHCLCYYECHPLSLQQICRIRLWRMLGPRAQRVIPDLHTSPVLKSFLLFSDHCPSQTET
uniref:SOCS box domain-containing protein n=1 Tax=Neogobius melanostomus TaxID=47308 RepID=A0A8C6SWG1_9GOBI